MVGLIFGVVKGCLMSPKAFHFVLTLTKHPITSLNINIIAHII